MNRNPLGILATLAITLAPMAFASGMESEESPPRLPPVKMPAAEKIQQSIDRGIEFLLKDQNANGSWGTAEQTKDLNIYAPVPGAHHAFRTAVTSLCILALCEVGGDREEVQDSIGRAEQWLLDHLPHLRRASGDALYNVWGHAYAIEALVYLHERTDDAQRQARFVELIRMQLELVRRYESVDGGWGYYDQRVEAKQPTTSSMSFVDATMLLAMDEARALGIDVPQRLVDRAVAALKRQRKPDFSYLYGEYLKDYPMLDINRPAGSLGRSQACNLALRRWGDKRVTNDVLITWLNRLFARNGWLDMGRKRPIPHESWFHVAGYFYYYGHYYGSLCIAELPANLRPEFQAHMATLMLRLQEKDGSWWDYPLYNYHQQYGTAYALMTLHRCQPQQTPSPK